MELEIKIVDKTKFEQIGSDFIKYLFFSSSEDLVNAIQDFTPQDTGNLVASWTPKPTSHKLTVGTSVYYAGYVELGTRYFTGYFMAEEGAYEFKQTKLPNLIKLAWLHTSI